jgi:hypothetical protein
VEASHHLILLGSALVLPSIFAGVFSERLGARLLLVFLGSGMLAGEERLGGTRWRWRPGRSAMSKITADHLGRGAFVYIRQSTADQLLHNPESRRRQYGLADRARQLGWTTVEVIDDDLGRSGGGINRPGFERLLAAICEGRVGAVFAIEASRLARNGRDCPLWASVAI